jgi:molybdate transport system substrate-binding protein
MKIVLFICIVLLLNINANTINVALSSNAIYVFEKLVIEFNKNHPKIKINTSISSSGKLTAQIMSNAPYDMFLSANMKYAQYIYEHNLSLQKPVIYAQGTLSLLSAKKLDFSNYTALLKSKQIKKVAIANDKTAPYGKASKELLENLGMYEKIKHKFVYGESIGQTLFYTLNAVNIGFVATSSLKSDKFKYLKEHINYINIPSEHYTPIKQGMVILKRAKNNKNVHKFYTFLQSKKAKTIFKNFGYII